MSTLAITLCVFGGGVVGGLVVLGAGAILVRLAMKKMKAARQP